MQRFALLLLAITSCKKDAPAPVSASGSAVAPPPDAVPTSITISKDGLSVMPNYNRKGKSDEETVADIQTKLPDFTVSFEVMEYADEHEEGYYSAKKGEVEVAQFFRLENDGVDVRVTGPMFATTEGVHPGDKLSAVIAKHPDVTCEANDRSELGMLQCTTAGVPGLVFVLNARTYKGKTSGKLAVDTLADLPIYIIAAGT
jgi:hypothetical protein